MHTHTGRGHTRSAEEPFTALPLVSSTGRLLGACGRGVSRRRPHACTRLPGGNCVFQDAPSPSVSCSFGQRLRHQPSKCRGCTALSMVVAGLWVCVGGSLGPAPASIFKYHLPRGQLPLTLHRPSPLASRPLCSRPALHPAPCGPDPAAPCGPGCNLGAAGSWLTISLLLPRPKLSRLL